MGLTLQKACGNFHHDILSLCARGNRTITISAVKGCSSLDWPVSSRVCIIVRLRELVRIAVERRKARTYACGRISDFVRPTNRRGIIRRGFVLRGTQPRDESPRTSQQVIVACRGDDISSVSVLVSTRNPFLPRETRGKLLQIEVDDAASSVIYRRARVKARNNMCRVDRALSSRATGASLFFYSFFTLLQLFLLNLNKRHPPCSKKKERTTGREINRKSGKGRERERGCFIYGYVDDERGGRTGFSYSRNFAKCHGRELYSPRLRVLKNESNFPTDRSDVATVIYTLGGARQRLYLLYANLFRVSHVPT